jgi:hypothetical protein
MMRYWPIEVSPAKRMPIIRTVQNGTFHFLCICIGVPCHGHRNVLVFVDTGISGCGTSNCAGGQGGGSSDDHTALIVAVASSVAIPVAVVLVLVVVAGATVVVAGATTLPGLAQSPSGSLGVNVTTEDLYMTRRRHAEGRRFMSVAAACHQVQWW